MGSKLPRALLALWIIFLLLFLMLPIPYSAAQSPSTTIDFQNGVSPAPVYSGGTDTYIDEDKPGTAFGAAASMLIDGSKYNSNPSLKQYALLRWDITDVPSGSQVEAASITLTFTNSTDGAYSIYAITRPWLEAEATWNNATSAATWEVPGAAGPGDRDTIILGQVTSPTIGTKTFSLNADGVAWVQRWVNDPASNNGIMIGSTAVWNGAEIAANAPTVAPANRPKLTITYQESSATLEPTPAATETEIGTPTVTTTSTSTAISGATSTATTPATATEESTEPATSTASPTESATDTPVASPTAYATLPQPQSDSPARNVILLIGDGMGKEHIKAAGYYLAGEQGVLSFESFPYQGEVITSSATSISTDSAAAASAMATGQKVTAGVISLAIPGDGHELTTLLEEAKQQGKQVGLVTSESMSGATPAAFGAHELSRDNRTQIIADYFRQTRPDLLFGGPGDGYSLAEAQSAGYTVVTNVTGLQSLSGEEVLVSGQFSARYEANGMSTSPHLSQRTIAALNLLDDDPDGFFLMVEGGLIDTASHSNNLPVMLGEVVEFSNTVQAAVDWAAGRSDTLIIVTADHETGGLQVIQNNGAGNYPSVTWSTSGHSTARVPVYAWGNTAEQVWGVLDNTEINRVVKGMRSPTATVTPTHTATSYASATETASPSATDEPTVTSTATSTATVEPTATSTVTSTVTSTATATWTPAPSPTETPQALPTATSTFTNTPSATPSDTPPPTSTVTNVPTLTETSTATVTHTPTATHTSTASPTATPTSTATSSPTSTSTATETATPEPSSTWTPKPAFTATSTPTITATYSVQVSPFQNGVSPASSYAGGQDTLLSQNKPSTGYGKINTLRVSGDDPSGSGKDTNVLLRWDVSTIPSDSVVESVKITLRVTDPSPHTYNMYALLRSWSASNANWTRAASGENWQIPGAAGSNDRGTAVLGTVTATTTGTVTITLNQAGVDLVQAWINDPTANYGLILVGPSNTNTLSFASNESSINTNRPKLEISYR